ncbi:hypothetical protein C8R47DRAFT_1324635, partial [Mycena vitilis]
MIAFTLDPALPSTSTPSTSPSPSTSILTFTLAPTLALHLRHSPHPPTFFETSVTFDPLFPTSRPVQHTRRTPRRPSSAPPKTPALN